MDKVANFKSGALNLALELMDASCSHIVVVDSDYQALPHAREAIAQAIVDYPTHALLQFPQFYRDKGLIDVHSELNHYFNFLKAIREKDPMVIRGALQEGILSSSLCHFGNISYRAGEAGRDFKDAFDLLNDLKVPDIVCQRLKALKGNLNANGLEEKITIGEFLKHSDSETNPFPTASNEAHTFLSEIYRNEYALPTI